MSSNVSPARRSRPGRSTYPPGSGRSWPAVLSRRPVPRGQSPPGPGVGRRRGRIAGTAGPFFSHCLRWLSATAAKSVSAVPGHYLHRPAGDGPNPLLHLPPQLPQVDKAGVGVGLLLDGYTGQPVKGAQEMPVLRERAPLRPPPGPRAPAPPGFVRQGEALVLNPGSNILADLIRSTTFGTI